MSTQKKQGSNGHMRQPMNASDAGCPMDRTSPIKYMCRTHTLSI